MRNILITGGLGYIGSHVAYLCLMQGYNVFILDNIWHKKPNNVTGATIIYGDVGDTGLVANLFGTFNIDAVIHMAGYIQVGESCEKPEKYFTNNVINTLKFLDTMLNYECKYFIFSSSAAVFGEPKSIPIDENHPKSPLNPYGNNKLTIEKALLDYKAKANLRFGVLRYFNAAGCDIDSGLGELHEPETHLIPLILQAASNRRDFISIYGDDYPTPDGTCIRDYIHVSDLGEAHLLLLNYLQSGGVDPFFNLGTNRGYSVKQVLLSCEEITGRKIPTRILPRRPGDSPILVADGTKARKILGWNPKRSDIGTILSDAWFWEKKFLK